MMMKHTVIIIVATSMFFNYVSAQIITVNVTGTINSVFADGDFELDESLVGSTMTGTCSYDPDTATDLNASSYWGEYLISAISMMIGNYTFTENPASPNSTKFYVARTDIVYNVETTDGLILSGGTPLDYTGVYITLFDLCNASVSGENDYLPTTFPDPSFFNYRNEFKVRLLGEFTISGVIDSITVIPEPISITLWGIGFFILRKHSIKKHTAIP